MSHYHATSNTTGRTIALFLMTPVFFVVFLLLHHDAQGQTVNISGFVSDVSTGQPLGNSNVVLQKIPDDDIRGAVTSSNGFYFMTGIEPGVYSLRVSHLGYTAHVDTISLGDIRRVTLHFSLEPAEEMMDEIEVLGYMRSGIARQTVGVQRITSNEIRRIPTPAGSGDLASYLLTLPGVVTAGDRGGQLFIRGGTPSQNMILIDGAMIYQPFHIVGFFSAFPQDLVAGADFYAGGFGSRYSGRISSVVDVQMREGDRYNHKGSVSVSPFVGEIMAEGPIETGVSSWIASVRRSAIEHTSPSFMSETQPLKFQSHYFKFSHSQDHIRCTASLLHTYDRGRMDYETNDSVSWTNFVLGGRCIYIPESEAFLREMNISISRISNKMNVGFSDLFSNVMRTSIDVHTMRFINDIRLDYGTFIHVKFLIYDMQELFFTPQRSDIILSGTGGYLEAGIPLSDRFTFTPGAVLMFYPGLYGLSLEPRIRASLQPFGRDREELSAAIGLYRQPLVGVADRRDASAVFTGWMLSPVDDVKKEAVQAMLGWSQSLRGGFQWSVEGFYKSIRNQPVPIWSTLAQFTSELALARGSIYGGDLRLDYRRGDLYGSIGYGYTFTEYRSVQDHFNFWYDEPIQKFHPPHDRRHQIHTNIGWDVRKYSFNVGWQMGTGLPFTQPMGFDEYFRYGQGLYDIKEIYGQPRMIMDKPYQARMPDYHRLDVSVERLFRFGNSGLRFQAGAINLYNRSNIFYYDVYTHRRIDQLPFVPYFSLRMEVR